MAVTAPKLALLLAVLLASGAAADQPHEVLQAVDQVAGALTAGNPSDAMSSFDKSMADYETLENDFAGLTAAYQITNEADILDEEDSASESQLTLRWVLTLTNRATSESTSKTAEVHVRLRLQKRKWKIVGFSPVDLFTP